MTAFPENELAHRRGLLSQTISRPISRHHESRCVLLVNTICGIKPLKTSRWWPLFLKIKGWLQPPKKTSGSAIGLNLKPWLGTITIFICEKHKSYREDRVPRRSQSIDRSPAATTAIIAAKDWAKTGTTRVYTFTTWKMWFRIIIT